MPGFLTVLTSESLSRAGVAQILATHALSILTILASKSFSRAGVGDFNFQKSSETVSF